MLYLIPWLHVPVNLGISLHSVTVTVLNVLCEWLAKLSVFIKILIKEILITVEVGKTTAGYGMVSTITILKTHVFY